MQYGSERQGSRPLCKKLAALACALQQQEVASAEALQAIESTAEADSLLVQVLTGSEVQERWAVVRAADRGAEENAVAAEGSVSGSHCEYL